MNATPGHTTLFSTLRHAAMTQDGRLLFVHAGIAPARSLQEQGDAFWWSADDILGLISPFERFSRVIRGFDRDRRGLVQRDFAISLDAGAGRGGPLLAAAFAPSGEVLDLLQG
jgi:serine/threonine protein phosphatase 1